MRIGIFGLLGVILAVLSLVLPWVSVTSVWSFQVGESPPVMIWDYNFAPLYIDARVDEFQDLLLLSSQKESYWNWNAAYGFSFVTGQHLLHATGLVLGVFSLFMTVSGFFAFDGIAKGGKKFRLIAALLWSGSVISQLCSMAWLVNATYRMGMLVTSVFQGVSFVEAGLGYFNLGLYVAVLSGVLLFASWFSPKQIFIGTTGIGERFEKLQPLPLKRENERSSAMFLVSFSATCLFFIFYILPLYSWEVTLLMYFAVFFSVTVYSWILAQRFVQKDTVKSKLTNHRTMF